jgi:hypothetical protein
MQSMAERGKGSSQGVGAEAAPDMTQMFQAMARQFITAITDLRSEVPREEERGCPFKRFERLHIPQFDGKRDPIECKNWLTDVKEILRLAGCTEEQKVQYTAYRLSGGSQTLVNRQEGTIDSRIRQRGSNLLATFSKRVSSIIFSQDT